ncbi:ORF2a [Physalis rugose mosaic virus]|uniref:ORF2a n=1 Tax=Physalis rugose mosaic virus TaxID=2607629 RepID=A0A5C1ISA9_9VIRU|nr:ORF2a [Physalis rugose mosaic virus]QEM20964.1 ORF2a [Physalis rugose mosaic virus]
MSPIEITVMSLALLQVPWTFALAAVTQNQAWSWTCLAMCMIVLECVLRPLRYSVSYLRIKVSPEPSAEEMCVLTGLPQFDPLNGIFGVGVYKGKEVKVLVQPNWWPLLPSPAINRGDGKECAIGGSNFSQVAAGAEPRSLVTLYTKSDIQVGFGSRVSWNGEEYLLTAYHVWEGLKDGFKLSKNGLMVPGDGAKLHIGCRHKTLDFALVAMPPASWSKLGVGKSQLRSFKGSNAYIKVFGGKSSTTLVSSSGNATRLSTPVSIAHSASTAPGWSGSPLYQDGIVVGIHTGYIHYGVSNEAVDVAGFLETINAKETAYADVGMREIEVDEMLTRTGQFFEFELEGDLPLRGYMTGHEIAIARQARDFKGKHGVSWADMVEEDEELEYKECSTEFLDSTRPLNCQRAAPFSELPFENLRPSSGQSQKSSPQPACPSTEWVGRIVSLERGLSELQASMSSQLFLISQKLSSLGGPQEDLSQKETPSCCRPQNSEPLAHLETSKRQSTRCSSSIPRVEPSCASGEGPSSTPTSSNNKSRRRRNRRRSTRKPAQALRGQDSGKQTKKSCPNISTSSKKECSADYISWRDMTRRS